MYVCTYVCMQLYSVNECTLESAQLQPKGMDYMFMSWHYPVGLLWEEDLLPLSCIVYGMEVVAGGAVWGVYTVTCLCHIGCIQCVVHHTHRC